MNNIRNSFAYRLLDDSARKRLHRGLFHRGEKEVDIEVDMETFENILEYASTTNQNECMLFKGYMVHWIVK